MRLCTEAHNNSGHRGRDPTFKKLSDAFWWPNQYLFIKEYATNAKCVRHIEIKLK